MKSKFVFGLIAAMLVLVLAPSSFAQVSITINNVSSSQEVQTNRAAEVSEFTSPGAGITVSGALVAQSNLSSSRLILTFPGLITSNTSNVTPFAKKAGAGQPSDLPAGDPIRIVAATGVFVNATIYTRAGNALHISLIGDADITGNTASGSFRVLGVRIQVNGLSGPQSATATLDNAANNFFLNTSSFPVINALGPGIGSSTLGAVSGQTDLGTIQVFTNRNVSSNNASIVVNEGFASAWRSEAQNEIDAPGAGGVVASQIRFTVENIPSGATLTWLVLMPTGSAITVSATSGSISSADTSNDSHRFTIAFTGTDLNAVEAIQVNFTMTPTTQLGTAPTAGNITVVATMAPVGSSTSTNALSSSFVPTYTRADVPSPALVIGTIVPANTSLLITYALRQGVFDTGIQIANTTLDPFGSTGGGATATAGNLVFDFYPRNPAGGVGTAFQLTTSSSTVFGGLSSDGTLAAGGSFVALLSEILARTSFTGDFSGYIFVRANFLNAHGTSTISDFRTYSLATNVLVLPPPAQTSRNAGVESLGF